MILAQAVEELRCIVGARGGVTPVWLPLCAGEAVLTGNCIDGTGVLAVYCRRRAVIRQANHSFQENPILGRRLPVAQDVISHVHLHDG